MFKSMPTGLPGVRVFTRKGKPIYSVREGFESACHGAGIDDFTFHDLRHTYVTNKCRQGHPYFVIMASTGHKTMSTFKRYNTVSEDDLKTLVGKRTGKDGQYLDIKRIWAPMKKKLVSANYLKSLVPGAGLEPARGHTPRDFKSLASTRSATQA